MKLTGRYLKAADARRTGATASNSTLELFENILRDKTVARLILLDSGPLGLLTAPPSNAVSQACAQWLAQIVGAGCRFLRDRPRACAAGR